MHNVPRDGRTKSSPILGNKIKDGLAIKSCVKRIAYQIYENNIDEKSIVIVGIGNPGKIFRNLIGN